jgi:hypothetical protein
MGVEKSKRELFKEIERRKKSKGLKPGPRVPLSDSGEEAGD